MHFKRTALLPVLAATLLVHCGGGTMVSDDAHGEPDARVDAHTTPDRPTPAPDADELDATVTDDTAAPGDDVVTMDDTATALDVVTPPDVVAPRDVVAMDHAPPPPPCTTRVYYGSAWIRPAGHPASYDDVPGVVTWDGACPDDSSGNSSARLSNGWQPYFSGRSACVIGLEYSASCTGVPTSCTTRITYGPAWLHGPGHAAQYDDADGPVMTDGDCHASGSQSTTTLSNGWAPYFSGTNGCELSFRYEQCGALYANPVVPVDCPDPGVLRDGSQYVMACTSGGAAAAYPIRTSPDLVHWSDHGWIFPAGHRPAWASGDFWAPEIHRVGTHYVAYFSARAAADGHLSIGAASGPTALGPFTDIGHPLVHDATLGLIDVSEFEDHDGSRYLIWKVDGNAVGQHTPIRIQRLAADGLSLTGSATTLITNDRAWEGGVVEGPWMIAYGGAYYLFYSGNGYASPSYALGVARASSPTGPFTKAAGPLVTSDGSWQGPGHGSVVIGPGGETVFVYHGWVAGHIGTAPGRQVLVDRVFWSGGWPTMPQAPSPRSQPLP